MKHFALITFNGAALGMFIGWLYTFTHEVYDDLGHQGLLALVTCFLLWILACSLVEKHFRFVLKKCPA